MESYQLLRISAVSYSLFHSECQSSLAASELFPEQSLLDKALEEIGEKIDKAGKTYEKLIDGEDQNTGRVDQLQNAFKTHHVRNVKKNNDEFSVYKLKRN